VLQHGRRESPDIYHLQVRAALPAREDREAEIVDAGHTPRVLLAMDGSENTTVRNREHHYASSALIACTGRHIMAKRVVQNDFFERASSLEL